MPIDLGLTALGLVGATSIALYVIGLRFHRTFFAKRGIRPPSTWMFRSTGDPDLEGPRRLALVLLPIDIMAMLVYLARA